MLSRLDSSSAFHAQLSALLEAPVGPENVGLVLSERMVNMPTQIVPPMYRMLQEELQWALEEVRGSHGRCSLSEQQQQSLT